MRSATILAVLCIAAPAAALAQTSYSRAAVTGPAVVPAEPAYPAYSAPYSCADLERQSAMLESEKVDYDRQLERLDAEGARLADELRRLDNTNAAAVADYNTRSDAHNRRVAEHNRRVADMNDAVARVTADIANATPYCTSPRWVVH
jgi:Skp family chaperone for outer membrane proteins